MASVDEAIAQCRRGLGIWEWASTDEGVEPDVVLACAGDIPTLETVAAAALLQEYLPQLRARVINVVDLMRLQPESEHPHGIPDLEFDALFTASRPVIFAYHGLSLADPPPHLPAHQPCQPSRPWLQGGGHDDDTV